MTRILLHERPPNFHLIAAVFGQQVVKGKVFAYGDAIYCPSGRQPSADLVVHEETHLRQQKELGVRGAERWWKRYLEDSAFRLSQEVEAYRAQLAACPGREYRRAVRKHAVKMLAGPTYGRLVTADRARALLA